MQSEFSHLCRVAYVLQVCHVRRDRVSSNCFLCVEWTEGSLMNSEPNYPSRNSCDKRQSRGTQRGRMKLKIR
jgi:hypothetical protein